MAITKAASELLALRSIMEKRAFDASDILTPSTSAAAAPKSSFGKFMDRAGKFAFPALATMAVAQGVGSGTESVGEAIGENAAGIAAGFGAQKLFDKFVPKSGRLGWLGKGLRGLHFVGSMASGLIGGIAGSMAGGAIGDKIAPWRRKMPSINVQAQNNPAAEYQQWQANQIG